MRRCAPLLVILMAFGIAPVWAFEFNQSPSCILNKVTTRFSAEQYVATKTALVTVGISAGVNDAGLQTIQDEVLKKLNDLSKGDWHIISFDRSLDASGLEKVQMQGQARLPSAALSNLRDKAKAMSKPGETFTLDNVEFTPSAQELRDANSTLRGDIYQQAKEEVDRLNKVYADQKYYVFDVNFVNNFVAPIAMPMNAMVRSANNAPESSSNNLAVGGKLTLNATVVLAALPDQMAKLMAH